MSASEPGTTQTSSYDAAARTTLAELAETQTSAEIEQLIESSASVEALYDVGTGTYLAARVEASASAHAITPRPSGCIATDACATITADHGYSGLGSLAINLPCHEGHLRQRVHVLDLDRGGRGATGRA